MRDILFRGKQKDLDIWVEGQYYKQTEYYGDPCIREYIITSTESLDYEQALECCAVRPETLGRYTGMTDKNGKKIFEGDIVADHPDEKLRDIYIIKFGRHKIDCCGCCYKWHDAVGFYADKGKEHVVGYEDVWNDLEVIGNIHDNPELLETKTSVSLVDGHIDE